MSQSNLSENVHVSLGSRSYDIAIVSDAADSIGDVVTNWLHDRFGESAKSHRAVVVTDQNLADSHAAAIERGLTSARWACSNIVLEPGENSKSLSVLNGLYDRMVAQKADRQTVVVAVGGGVVGDVAGFLAASFNRGIPFVQVPTTLLAQVDSSVGGKVGVNHPQAKNLIGAFYQPLGVFIDTTVLQSLPDRDYRSGLAEVVKYGVILDANFFEFLENNIDGLNRRDADVLRHVISCSCRLKADVVEQDEYERTGLRAVLNYGHTFAHAFEALLGYGELQHGEAVSIGMVCASRLAERLKLIDADVTQRQVALLKAVHLPISLPAESGLSIDAILERMSLDKKNIGGKLRFVLPTKLGHVELMSDIDEAEVRKVLEEALNSAQ